MIKKSPILITGIPRSGASMVTAAIHFCGAFGGNMSQKTQSFKRGMYENVAIRECLVKPYLRNTMADAKGQYPLSKTDALEVPKGWKDNVERILSEEGYTGGSWLYKDARSVLIWPVWHHSFPDAKWVIVRRRTGDILESCVKTAFMEAFKNKEIQNEIGVKDEKEGWLWWVHEYEKRFVELVTEGANCKVIWPERMVNGDYQQLYELCEWLGLEWKEEALGFIDSLLWKGKSKERRK